MKSTYSEGGDTLGNSSMGGRKLKTKECHEFKSTLGRSVKPYLKRDKQGPFELSELLNFHPPASSLESLCFYLIHYLYCYMHTSANSLCWNTRTWKSQQRPPDLLSGGERQLARKKDVRVSNLSNFLLHPDPREAAQTADMRWGGGRKGGEEKQEEEDKERKRKRRNHHNHY